MSTKITVNVSGNNLLAKNKEQQAANRQQRLQKEEDEKFLEDIEKIEKVQLQKAEAAAQSNGAIPEYSIPIETSAQRADGAVFGWCYTSYEDVIEQEYPDKNKYRVAVGSGNGRKWAYIDTELATPSNARDIYLASGVAVTQSRTVEQAFITSSLGVEDCTPSVTLTITRTYTYSDTYVYNNHFLQGAFLVPINDKTSLLVGSVCLRWMVVRSASLGSQSFSLPVGYSFDGIGGYITNNAGCFYEDRNDDASYDELFDFTSGTTNLDSDIVRKDFAFVITQTNVRSIEVPEQMAEVLEAVYPTPALLPNDGPGWTVSFWRDTTLAALGVGFNVSNRWGPVIKGAPSIFDIIDNGYDFNLYQDAVSAQSDYNANPPLYAADSILKPGDPLDKEVANFYSAFYFGAVLTDLVYVPRQFFVLTEAPLSEYVYLKEEDRKGNLTAAPSNYYTYATEQQKAILEDLPVDPSLAFMYDKNPEPGISQVYDGYNVSWAPKTGYKQTKITGKLSGQRSLPPTLFDPELTRHPMIYKQPTSIPSFIRQTGDNGHSAFNLYTLFWTGWGKNWRLKLIALGFKGSDLRP